MREWNATRTVSDKQLYRTCSHRVSEPPDSDPDSTRTEIRTTGSDGILNAPPPPPPRAEFVTPFAGDSRRVSYILISRLHELAGPVPARATPAARACVTQRWTWVGESSHGLGWVGSQISVVWWVGLGRDLL